VVFCFAESAIAHVMYTIRGLGLDTNDEGFAPCLSAFERENERFRHLGSKLKVTFLYTERERERVIGRGRE
jgi:hypothetical protein